VKITEEEYRKLFEELEYKKNPTKDDALMSSHLWHVAEENSKKYRIDFHERMNLCSYSEWAIKKSLGMEVEEFKGVPRLVLTKSTNEH